MTRKITIAISKRFIGPTLSTIAGIVRQFLQMSRLMSAFEFFSKYYYGRIKAAYAFIVLRINFGMLIGCD